MLPQSRTSQEIFQPGTTGLYTITQYRERTYCHNLMNLSLDLPGHVDQAQKSESRNSLPPQRLSFALRGTACVGTENVANNHTRLAGKGKTPFSFSVLENACLVVAFFAAAGKLLLT